MFGQCLIAFQERVAISERFFRGRISMFAFFAELNYYRLEAGRFGDS
jgi:hypothetical protein